ncbi:MAG: hypothetical protein KAQ87_00635 [Candidatus Pacebacteria bacterium]|nr:hypothetical protein [Candidatus Paceibacterota bacterium]
MSSINLLPKNDNFNEVKNRKWSGRIVFGISILLVAIPVIFFAGLYFLNKNSSEEIENLNLEIKTAEEEIEKSFSKTELLLANSDVDNAISLLSERVYFTKIINIFQENLIDGVYLNSLNINSSEEDSLTSRFDGVARDYSSLISQIDALKSNDVFEKVDIKSVSIGKDNGYIDFQGNLTLKQNAFFYDKNFR